MVSLAILGWEEYGMTYSMRNTELTISQYQFRVNALAGNLPGVKKASW